MSRSDRYASFFFLALAAYICQQSLGIGVGTLRQPGPGLLPFYAGVGIGLLSLAVLIGTFRKAQGRSGPPVCREEAGGSRVTVAAVSVSLFCYVLAVIWLGFLLATFLFVLFLFRLVERESWWRSLLKSLLVTAGNYLIFVQWLGIRLPKGVGPW